MEKIMSGWECKYILEGKCKRSRKECEPNAVHCVLRGKVIQPFKEIKNLKLKAKKKKEDEKY